MLTELEVAAMLSGRTRQEESAGRQTSTAIAALAASDSSSGTVMVDLGGTTVSQDGQQAVEIPTTVDVRAGDTVRVSIAGAEGSARRPTVTGVIGGGDRTRDAVDQATSDASQAKDDAGAAKSDAKDAQNTANENGTAIAGATKRIEAEENARKKTDSTVQNISTQLNEVKDGLQLQINSVKDGVGQLSGWIKATTDADGNPELDIASSGSPIVSKQTNGGLRYTDRADTTLLEIDARTQSVRAAHFAAQDVSIGKWQWVPTNGGQNLTLMWIGG